MKTRQTNSEPLPARDGSLIADRFTPAVKWVLARAAKIATIHEDKYIRLAHLEGALKTVAEMHKDQRRAESSELENDQITRDDEPERRVSTKKGHE